jgi:hypothetical protein
MIRRSHPLTRTALTALFVGLLPPTLSAMDVQLKSGSVRSGEPDASTNEATLRLRVGDPDAYIVFGIPWDDIAEIREGAEVWSPDQFDDVRNRFAEPTGEDQSVQETEQRPAGARRGAPTPPERPASTRPLWESPRKPAANEPANSRLRFIEIDAVAANWDANNDWDGIVLRIWPLNQSGDVLHVSGTLDVTLTANRGYPPLSDPRGEQIQPIGRWTRSVRVSNYGADAVSVRLPFQAIHPDVPTAAETDRWHVSHAHPDWWLVNTSGDVHVRFSVPGHGVFTATTSLPVRLRRFSPLRDQYFLRHGTRNFPGE